MPTAAQPPVVGRMLGRGVAASLVGTALATGAAALLLHPAGQAALSALVAGLVATAALMLGLYAVSWLLRQPEVLAVPGAFMILATVIILLTALALALSGGDWVHPVAVATGALTVVVLAQVALVHAYVTGPKPFLELEEAGA